MKKHNIISLFFVVLLLGAALSADAAEYVVYADAGLPAGTDVYTWYEPQPDPPDTPIFDGLFSGLEPPEGENCFKTAYSDWAGWGVFFLAEPCDLSTYSSWDLTFWVKTNTNLKVEIKDIDWATAKHISSYGWNGTNTWQKITIPIGDFARNLEKIVSPFMVTMDQAPFGTFYIDDVKWVETGNHDPIITSIPVTRTIAEEPYRYDVNAIDHDDDVLTYLLLEAPATMSIHSPTGMIQWTPALADIGSHSVIVKVDDAKGGYTLQPYSVQVISPDESLYQISLPYIKYFLDRALNETTEFAGLTRSFQDDLGGHNPEDQKFINYGAVSYDQSILGRISLDNDDTTILDTYLQHLGDTNNPLMKTGEDYYDAAGNPIINGPFKIIRILGRQEPEWWTSWDWVLDTGAAACLSLYAAEAYQQTQNAGYLSLAILFGEYMLKLQDVDGGLRYGPIGMYHPETPITLDYYWHLKSTEQNERALYALEALYQITNSSRYHQAAAQIKDWLKDMYSFPVHLFHSASQFDGSQWVKAPLGTDEDYVATDVTALAPLEMMFTDPHFGSTQAERDAEVDAMFAAIEVRTAFLDHLGMPQFFRFSVSQDTDDYGSVEISSQMALAYLRAGQIYAARGEQTKAQRYLNKYNSLVVSLEDFFFTPVSDPNARIAPYASYFADHVVAGGVSTGTGYYTYNCQAALASAYFAFAKAGYDPTKISAGTTSNYILNLSEVPWYEYAAPYNSTGVATAQMILNYIRAGAEEPLLTQDEIYEYVKDPQTYDYEMTADEMDKVLGHFDPYDYLVSNSYDNYDLRADGNPFQGYNFSVDTYDPDVIPGAANEYMRDICHWMSYQVTQQSWWEDGELVARPHTPAAVPVYGVYYRWIVVKGCATSENPCPQPHTNPWNTPDFTVYGLWIKDPYVFGLGKDTYKTASECLSTYFLPLSTGDGYDGKFLQVAEPPPEMSHSTVRIAQPTEDLANLKFIGVQTQARKKDVSVRNKTQGQRQDLLTEDEPLVKKQSWRDMVDVNLLSDPEAIRAFDSSQMGESFFVKRLDSESLGYYLVPFGNRAGTSRGSFLTSAAMILDADDGHFKEATWTDNPEALLKVSARKAIYLIRKYVLKKRRDELHNILRSSRRRYFRQLRAIFRTYARLIGYIRNGQAELVWEPNGYSPSPYKPYWKVDTNGYIWYVTQEGKVYPQTELKTILKEIETNRSLIFRNYYNR